MLFLNDKGSKITDCTDNVMSSHYLIITSLPHYHLIITPLPLSDWGYMRENPGDPCLRISGVTDEFFVPSTCAPGTKYNMTMGYMKIEGDACEGGEESIFKEKEVNCPDKGEIVHCIRLNRWYLNCI